MREELKGQFNQTFNGPDKDSESYLSAEFDYFSSVITDLDDKQRNYACSLTIMDRSKIAEPVSVVQVFRPEDKLVMLLFLARPKMVFTDCERDCLVFKGSISNQAEIEALAKRWFAQTNS